MTVTCRSCGAQIIFGLTEKARRMPLDPDPVPDGNVLVSRFGGDLLVRVVDPKTQPAGTALYRSHFASCPDAAKHRKGHKR